MYTGTLIRDLEATVDAAEKRPWTLPKSTLGPKVTHVFIKHSPTFWEVRPPTKAGMRKLLDYIQMYRAARKRETA